VPNPLLKRHQFGVQSLQLRKILFSLELLAWSSVADFVRFVAPHLCCSFFPDTATCFSLDASVHRLQQD
jgi:hypothetical protein